MSTRTSFRRAGCVVGRRGHVEAVGLALVMAAGLACGCGDGVAEAGHDGAVPTRDGATVRDGGTGRSDADAGPSDGQSCDRGGACPGDQVAVREPEGCRCRFRCDPKKQDCPAGSGRICSALADDHGKPLPYGACLLDEGADIGQPCAPEKCRQTLFCVGVDTETAFCRQSCSGDPAIATCPKEMVCSAVRDSSGAPIGHACTPAEGPVTEGGDCSHESCAAALLCVADRKLGHPLCRRVCEPAYTLCPAGTQCTEIVDDAGTRLGYACVPP